MRSRYFEYRLILNMKRVNAYFTLLFLVCPVSACNIYVYVYVYVYMCVCEYTLTLVNAIKQTDQLELKG